MLTELFKKQAPKHPVNPRFRAYGKARLDIARRAASRLEWDQLWKEPAFPFPFTWGEWWKQCIEYKVDDFAAEVGFYTDILGLPVIAFDPNYAMFTSPAEDFYLAIVPALEPGKSTPPEALRIQFMVANIFETVRELERRGIVFEQKPQPCERGSSMFITYFRTPHGLCVDLWGMVPMEEQPAFGLESEEGAGFDPPDGATESLGSAYEMDYREDARSVTEDLHAGEEEDTETGSESDLRFFVEPASHYGGSDELEEPTKSSGLNFGFVEREEKNWNTPQQSTESEDEESFEYAGEDDEEEDEDSLDDDSYPVEYVYDDDL
jgi:catechol 2,3-dioxygenase-like lactoylglutathione lyase family enzyme